ncbi:hypothetical protein CONLIGDRAFT_684294 [Coniochaeta ligniaria NRRL 30616]|uniref:Uncharacterized protein n=1 Tax=Coniochaeta ligniaria NRRL 30616 TaxID=1408157 RepID=A0A1J7IDI5_9PEZI|nr:hypothetical protein CONLIGDRAFT_684294 [Coniochaeta ligniaria NRRL 30616]
MVDASTYSAVTQGHDAARPLSASTASPASVSATFSSPSAFLSLSEYAFTPLSMVGSDLSYRDDSDDDFKSDEDEAAALRKHPKSNARVETLTTSTSPSRSTATDMGRNTAVTSPRMLSRPTPGTVPARPTAASIVGTLVHSLEHLHAAGKGYEPVSATYANVDISIRTLQQVARTTSSSSTPAPLVRPKPRPLPSRSQPVSRTASVRTVSSTGVASFHLSPNPNNVRSGSRSGSVAALEATAERFSLTSSIDDAIRKAHDELKRSESRRSSVLRASSGRVESDNETSVLQSLQSQLAAISRQNSIVGINSAARHGGYSPAAYVMSPTHSISNASTRYRSVSKASSLGVPSSAGNVDNFDLSEASNAERFPSFLSRHGPGKSSVRSVVSSRLSLVDIAETEPPMTLTLDALDEADRAAEAGDESEDEDTIRATAHQRVEEDHIQDPDVDDLETPQAEVLQPMLGNDFLNFSAPGPLQLHQPNSYDPYTSYEQDQPRPRSAGSGTTYERNAFGDFDGVHCDPDTADFPEPPEHAPPPPPQQKRMSRPLSSLPPRPQSYFDMQTGQQMLYYPARVPAMLNLPPKLSKTKKPDRQKVRSQVLSVMPMESRDSRVWLPDPVSGTSAPLMSGAVDGNFASPEPSPARASFIADADPAGSQPGSFHGPSAQEVNGVASPGKREREIKRPQKLADKRKSQMPGTEELPPHLRASVFFDLPEQPPMIVVKDHSAMATLDSILDASASAPVSAFTDHAFAGTLGSEVYGIEKKKKRKTNTDFGIVEKRSSSSLAALQTNDHKKRGSFLSLLAHTRKSSENLSADRRSTALGVGEGVLSPSAEGSSKDGNSPNVDQGPFSPSLMDPDSDEEPDKEAEKDEEDEDDESEGEDLENVYQGRPTTLLAELQIRKQRNKLRTRPVHKVYPNGLHSTLLELDTVAEVERSMRKGKKVNLAWEDPSANPDLMEEEDDEEIPLAMLAAARAAAAAKGVNKSTLDVGVIMDEVNRPLGLMERREMEENEPLSRRRDRIQGRTPRETLNLETMQKRMTQLSLAHGGAGLKSQSRLALPLPSPSYGAAGSAASIRSVGPQPEPEVEGETLAQRRKRLQGDALPTARPVSGSFSLELLEQFGGDEDKGQQANNGKGKEPASGEQQEETLGQRRRRLQAEREAREREMAGKANNHRLSRRMSMADILIAHPLEPPQGVVDPRELERQRLQAVAAAKQRDRDARMAALHNTQTPQAALSQPSIVGAPNGGYMGGQFNDGLAGGLGAPGSRSLAYASAGRTSGGVPPPLLQRMSTLPAAGAYGGNAVPLPLSAPVYGAAMTMTGVDGPYGMGGPHAYGGGFNFGGMPPTQGQVDMVERWRQSIRP